MPLVSRVILAIGLLAVAAFSVFGFVATYEPSTRNIWPWRIGYGAIVVATLLGAGSLAFQKR